MSEPKKRKFEDSQKAQKLQKECLDNDFKADEPIPFLYLVKTFELVSEIKGESSKERMKEALANTFSTILKKNEKDLVPAYYMSILKLSPDYIPTELGIGDQILLKSIAKITGRTDKQVRDSYNIIGDMGTVAMESKKSQKTMDNFFTKKAVKKPLTVSQIFNPRLRKCTKHSFQCQKLKEIMLRLRKKAF